MFLDFSFVLWDYVFRVNFWFWFFCFVLFVFVVVVVLWGVGYFVFWDFFV